MADSSAEEEAADTDWGHNLVVADFAGVVDCTYTASDLSDQSTAAWLVEFDFEEHSEHMLFAEAAAEFVDDY